MSRWMNKTQADLPSSEDRTSLQILQNEEAGAQSAKSLPKQKPVGVEYTDLVAALNSTVSVGLNKIELLPDSHLLEPGLNVLVEDYTVTIPKRTLKNAFASARQVFFDNLEFDNLAQSQEAVLDASAVMLLLDPEYVTAINARKRIIMNWERQSESKGRKRIVMELWMLDSMFMSPLNKHTKSPTLWAHRRWLIQRLPWPEPLQVERLCLPFGIRKEREVSMVALTAADTHPRNYYAWGYLRWWITENLELLERFGHCPTTQSSTNATLFDLQRLANSIQEWCLKHPSDTSGWSFLTWLITRPDTCADGPLRLHGPFITIAKSVLDRTRSLRLRNESVWVFLRTVMSSKDMPQDIRQMFLDDARAIIESDSERAKSQSIAQAALLWLELHRRKEGTE